MRWQQTQALARTASAAMLLCLAGVLLVGAAGCVGPAARRSESTVHLATNSIETSAVAGAVEVRALLARFWQPEEPGDVGYELLGAHHNDTAGWVRGVVLANTNYGMIVHSLVSQQSAIPTGAIAMFDTRLASKGATSTYDLVVNSEWTSDGGANPAERRLTALIPASTFMGDLFDRHGHLADSYSLKSLATMDDLARATFTKPGAPDVILEFQLARDHDGRLRIVGVGKYAQFKQALAGTDLVEGLP